MRRLRIVLSLVGLIVLLVGLLPLATGAQEPTRPVVVRYYFESQEQLDAVAGQIDTWEVHRQEGYAVAAVSPEEYAWLQDLGYRLEVDEAKTDLLGIQAPLDPRFYYFDDYYSNSYDRYVVDFLQLVNATYPDIVELIDIGDAWMADHGGHHRDLWVLRITNEDPAFGDILDKPAFVLHSEVHAREVAVPELAIRYIDYFTGGYDGEGGYGVDPDVTWLVDWHTVYVEVMANPDGHWQNEWNTGNYWRKNMNDTECSWGNYGIDLNRNHSFKWGCCGGSSGDPCDQTYRGLSRASEPETYHFQDFVLNVIPDQNGPNGDDEIPPAAPITTTGFLISLHSYHDSILWPWNLQGHPPAPNGDEMEAIARKMSAINPYYEPTGSLYYVDGTTRDWSYGKLGIPSYVFEVGPVYGTCGGFFPPYGCVYGIDGMPRNFVAENLPVFLYAHKATRQPYAILHGPDAQELAVSPDPVEQGTPVDLTALIQDHRYGGDPLAPVGAAEYFVGYPGEDGTGTPMAPQDGSWGGTTEWVEATVDTASLDPGTYYILVHGQEQGTDYWGPFTAVFLTVEPGQCDPVEIVEVAPLAEGCLVTFTAELGGDPPYDYAWDFGAYGTSTETVPVVDFGSSGTYPYTLTAFNCQGDYSDTLSATVTVTCCAPVHDAGFDWTPVTPTVGEVVSFSGWASGTAPISYSWDLGIGELVFGRNVTQVYTTAGDYQVVLTATNACGEEVVSGTIAVEPPPCEPVHGAGFDWTCSRENGWGKLYFPSRSPWQNSGLLMPEFCTPTVGEAVTFSGWASGTLPIDFWWDWGDGAHGHSVLPMGISPAVGPYTDVATHTYTVAGSYEVTMVAANCETATATVTHTVTVVEPSCEPVHGAGFDWTCSRENGWGKLYFPSRSPWQNSGIRRPEFCTPTVGEAVTFSGWASGTLPIEFWWDWGDGAHGHSVLPMGISPAVGPYTDVATHTYTVAGSYEVTMVAANCETATATVTHTVTVVEPAPCQPVEVLTVTTAISGCQVDFGAELEGEPPFTYSWDFGAYGTSTEANPTVDFGGDGAYAYLLTVWNCGGAYSDTASGEVTVTCGVCQPVTGTDFVWAPVTPTVGEAVTFSAEAIGSPPITYTWDFGDQSGGMGAGVVHTYAASGTYTVTLAATNCGTATQEVAHTIVVLPAPLERYTIYLPIIAKSSAP